MKQSESIKNISSALLKAQSEMGSATKGASNPFFKSRYADLNSIREASIPVLNKYGITVLQPMTVVDGRNYIETTLLHESGEMLSSLTEIVVNKVNDPQAQGSGQSYARRYGLQSFLCIGAEDDDGEKAMDRKPKATTSIVTQSVATNVDLSAGVVTKQTVADAAAPRRPSFRKNTTVSKTDAQDDI